VETIAASASPTAAAIPPPPPAADAARSSAAVPGYCPEPALALRLIRERFLNRTDEIAVLMPWDKPSPAEPIGELDALLRAHLLGERAPAAKVRHKSKRGEGVMKGHFRLGAYCPAPDGTTKWLCLDFDGAGHADALADPQAAALETAKAFAAAGFPAHLERSKSCKGWHLWCFFEQPIQSGKARALARLLAPANAPLISGGVADPIRAHGVEIFPKQEQVRRGARGKGSKGGFGNMVWLPWYAGAAEGGNVFYRLGATGALEPYAPFELAAASPAAVEAYLAAHRPRKPTPSSSAARPPAARTDPGMGGASAELGALDQLWAEVNPAVRSREDLTEWKPRALAALRLEDVYGEYLTGGETGDGWLQCRDPSSPSGDRNPSAGVATGKGTAERGTFHSFISGTTLDVFDFLQRQGGCSSFGEAVERIARLTGVTLPECKPLVAPGSPSAMPPPRGAARLPKIEVNGRQMRDVVADAWSAVLRANAAAEPIVFQRAGHLVRLRRTDGDPHIEPMTEDVAYGHLLRIADWVREGEEGEIHATPPKDVPHDILAFPDARLPELEAVVSTPIFDREGKLVATPGYDRAARLWLHERPGFRLPAPVPERPTESEIYQARQLIVEDLLQGFPFVKSSDLAHAVAAVILPFARRLVSGCTPLHLIEAPSAGTGKGLLADAVAIIATGNTSRVTTITEDEDEIKKRITSTLSMAPQIVLIDNVRKGLDSAQLAAAVTADPWQDRPFGENQRMIELPNKATWLVTANNPTLSLEMARRCVRIRLDAGTDRPWERDPSEFRHPDFKDWLAANRAQLVHAVLTLIQAWLAAGRPKGSGRLGSFESWVVVIGGILEVALIPGFLGDCKELYEVADVESAEWRVFCASWWERFQSNQVKPAELLKHAQNSDLLEGVLGDKGERSQSIRLGKALQRMRDRQFAQWRITAQADTHSRGFRYRLIAVEDAGSQAKADRPSDSSSGSPSAT
jgi:hypothetical protein